MTEKPVERGLADGRSPIRLVGGIALAALVVVAFFWWVGPDVIVAAVVSADPLWLGAAVGVSLLGLGARILALSTVLDRVVDCPLGEFGLVYLATGIPRNLLPGGDAAGGPIVAYGLSRETDTPFEAALASLSVGDLLNLVASFCVAGAGAILVVLGLPPGDPIPRVVAVVAVAALVLIGLTVAGLTQAETLTRGSAALARFLGATLGRLPLTSHVRRFTEIRRREIAAVRHNVEAISASPRVMWSSYGLSVASWVGGSLPLYFALRSVGVEVAVGIVLLVVPVASLAAILPIPGGLGGVELAGTGLLVLLAGIDPGTAGGATLLYRFATYWLEVGLGVVAVSLLGTRPTVVRP